MKKPYIPKGCDQQGRYVDGAHAASELDDYKPDPLWWATDVVAAVGLTAVILFLLILFGLIP